MRDFDVIVLGLGGMGSAALYHLARRGARVCGIEQFGRGHALGSSHGRTRLIRRAYFEHPGYVPLVDASWRWWQALEVETGETLLRRTGLLLAGAADSTIIRGTLVAAKLHNLDIAVHAPDDAAQRWPGFAFNEDAVVLFEAEAGVLFVEACVLAHLQAAEWRGATAWFDTPVVNWQATASEVRVDTPHATLTADRLIICGGPWTSRLLGSVAPALHVLRKTVFWYPECSEIMRSDEGCPAFGFDTPAGFCYGFPRFDASGVKIANHSGGDMVADPNALDRTVKAAESEAIDAFRLRHVPGVRGGVGERGVCMYTMSADGHFVVDVHPQHPRVIAACGFSGHGFKFAPVIGETLAAAGCGERIAHGLLRPWLAPKVSP